MIRPTIITRTSLLFLLFLLSINALVGQKTDKEHQLLWRISSPDLEHDSYLYGTMHLRDGRVFNLPDSVYYKMKECKYFALEVHPDTMIKNMIVSPFAEIVDQAFEDELEDPIQDSLNQIFEEEFGSDLPQFDTEDPVNIDLLMRSFFKKGKEKRTFLDAHLYHISKLFKKELVGLESLDDRRVALEKSFNSIDFEDSITISNIVNSNLNWKKDLSELIEIYETGNLKELSELMHYDTDSSMIYRNQVMVKNGIKYFDDGGIFMTVGVGHLPGSNGMLQMFKDLGYAVEPVLAKFSRKGLFDDFINQEIPWTKHTNEGDGFSVSLPDKPYEFRPESIGGVIKVGYYPDLGTGHHYYVTAFPNMYKSLGFDEFMDSILEELEGKGVDLKKVNTKKIKFKGKDAFEIKYDYYSLYYYKFIYLLDNNYLYIMGFFTEAKKELKSEEANRFFDSFETFELEAKEDYYVDEEGAFRIKANGVPQTYQQIDNELGEGGIVMNFTNIFDVKSSIYYILIYTHSTQESYFSDVSDALNDNASNFITSDKDKILIDTTFQDQDSSFFRIYSSTEQQYLNGFLKVRGNRLYQLLAITADENSTDEIQNVFNSFDLLPYQPIEEEEWNTELIDLGMSVEFPGKMQITNASIDMNVIAYPEVDSITQFGLVEPNSSANYLIEVYEMSPYFSIPRDSFESIVIQYFETPEDTIVSNKAIELGAHQGLEIAIENANNHVRSTTWFIPLRNKLIRAVVRQDVNESDNESIERFLSSIVIPDSVSSTTLFRDSSEVRSILIQNLNSEDSLTVQSAVSHLSYFDFTEEEKQIIVSDFEEAIDSSRQRSDYYFSTIIRELGESLIDDEFKLLRKAYNESDPASNVRLDVITALINHKDSSSVSTARELLSNSFVEFEYRWRLDYIFDELLDSMELVQFLMPDAISWVVQDSSILFTEFFSQVLEANAISESAFDSIYNELVNRTQLLLDQSAESIEEGNPVTGLYDLVDLANLTSCLKTNPVFEESYLLLVDWDEEYYYGNGIIYCLRNDIDFDHSKFDTLLTSTSGMDMLYTIHKSIPIDSFVPDSMFQFDKYAMTLAKSYYEEDNYELDECSLFKHDLYDGHHYYIFKGKATDYQGETYWVDLFVKFNKEVDEFEVLEYEDYDVDYYYLEEKEDNLSLEYFEEYYELEID